MDRVARLAAASEVAEPSPELCLIAGLIIALTAGKPKQVERLVRGMKDFTDAHREMSGVMRLRGSEYDTSVLECMAKASEWATRMEPFLLMMARR